MAGSASPDDDQERQRRRFNFSRWKRVVGLPESFPKLFTLEDPELDPDAGFYMGFAHEGAIDAVLDSATNVRLAVVVDPGQGCTTLSRFILRESSRYSIRLRAVPVRISIDDIPGDESDFLEFVYETCREAIVKSLVLQPWHRPLGAAVYAALIGAPGQAPQTLEPQRIALAAALGIRLHPYDIDERRMLTEVFGDAETGEVNWAEVGQLAPRMAVPASKLIADLGRNHQIELALQLDLSSTLYKEPMTNLYTEQYFDVVQQLSSAVKALHEQDAVADLATGRGPGGTPSIRTMLFTSEDGLEGFTSEWDQTFLRQDYPTYGPPDVFAILAYQYPQKVQASGIVRTQAMATILSDELVNDVYDGTKSLHGIIDALEEKMLGKFDDWGNARIRLE